MLKFEVDPTQNADFFPERNWQKQCSQVFFKYLTLFMHMIKEKSIGLQEYF